MKKGYDRNYWALVMEGTMFTGGVTVLSTGGAMALFIHAMTGSNTLIGLAVTLQTLALSFGQLLGAPLVNTISKLPETLSKMMLVQRSAPLFMALPLFLGAPEYWSVTIFLVMFSVFWFVDGMTTVSWGELCARAVKFELRGHMMGMLITIGGILSLAVGLVLAWLLATPTLDNNLRFAWIFVLGCVLLLLSVIFIRLVRDPSPLEKPEKLNFKKFYAKVPSIVRASKPFQHVLIARIPSFVGFASLSFLVVFGAHVLLLSDAHVSWLVYAGIIGGILGGVLLGEASRRFGNKSVILWCNFGVVIAMVMAILLAMYPSLGYIWLFFICVLGSITASNWFGYLNYFLDIAPEKERSEYQIVGQGIAIPFSFAGLAMGALVDAYGYEVMFMVCGGFALLAILLSFRLLSKGKVAILANENGDRA